MAEARGERRFTVILVASVVEYSRLMSIDEIDTLVALKPTAARCLTRRSLNGLFAPWVAAQQ